MMMPTTNMIGGKSFGPISNELHWKIRDYIRSDINLKKHYKDLCMKFNLTLEEVQELIPDAVMMPSGFLSLSIPRDRCDYLS